MGRVIAVIGHICYETSKGAVIGAGCGATMGLAFSAFIKGSEDMHNVGLIGGINWPKPQWPPVGCQLPKLRDFAICKNTPFRSFSAFAASITYTTTTCGVVAGAVAGFAKGVFDLL